MNKMALLLLAPALAGFLSRVSQVCRRSDG